MAVGPSAIRILGPLALRLPFVRAAVSSASRSAGKTAKARTASTAKTTTAKKAPAKKAAAKKAPSVKKVTTKGERKQASDYDKFKSSASYQRGREIQQKRLETRQAAKRLSGRGAGIGSVGAAVGVMYAYGGMNKPKKPGVPRSGEERREPGALRVTVPRPSSTSRYGTPGAIAKGGSTGSAGSAGKKGSGRSSGSSGSRAVGTRTSSAGLTGAGGGGKAGKVKPKKTAKAVPTVSQSRTMWVKKGEMVGGKEVTKGYLAQYGKAEKRVSAKVNIVTDTESGKKAGETWRYGKGKTVAKVKKKRNQ
jgi:hypothetical protein